jgi:hypothetical protein
MTDESGAVGGMKIDRRKRSIWRIPVLVYIVHHKSHTTSPGIELGPPLL